MSDQSSQSNDLSRRKRNEKKRLKRKRRREHLLKQRLEKKRMCDELERITCKDELLDIVMNTALDNKMRVFGSAVVRDMSGILPNDLDITGDLGCFQEFVDWLGKFFSIRVISKTSHHQRYTIFWQSSWLYISLDIDFVPETKLPDLPADFEVNSLVVFQSQDGQKHTDVRVESIDRPLADIMRDASSRILRRVPFQVTKERDLYTLMKMVQRSQIKRVSGWDMSEGWDLGQRVLYSHSRLDFYRFLQDCIRDRDVCGIVTDYMGHCFLDDLGGGFAPNCEAKHNTTCTKDYVFATPCCKTAQCIPCAMQEMERYGVMRSTRDHTMYKCSRCIGNKKIALARRGVCQLPRHMHYYF